MSKGRVFGSIGMRSGAKVEMKKRLATILALSAVCALSVTAFAFAGCGGDEETATSGTTGTTQEVDETPKGPAEGSTIEYQFLGSYDELVSWFANFEFLGNMYSDGTAVIYMQEETSMGMFDLTTYGTWTCEEDRDGIVTFSMDVTRADGTVDNYQTYEASDNTFSFTYTFYFLNGAYPRDTILTGSSEVKFEDHDEWVESITGKYDQIISGQTEGETKETAYTFTGDEVYLDSDNSRLSYSMDLSGQTYTMYYDAAVYLYADGTAEVQEGMLTSSQVFFSATGTWSIDSDNKLTITVSNSTYSYSETYTVALTNGAYTFSLKVVNDEGSATVTVTCASGTFTEGTAPSTTADGTEEG